MIPKRRREILGDFLPCLSFWTSQVGIVKSMVASEGDWVHILLGSRHIFHAAFLCDAERT